ncbi:hypothetical protein GCM10012288_03710 [Malaciobacter pacificus]|jgi:rhodanese-related sulfurtransferase|uniref:Rhodanese-like domain-containing protein n=1 Tax=Malaciobacter pacificus TaxID=1080223 RepID=A0A5C2H482_9BACT|nr:rhodanese-like domain-containing protein [Malaciobacter pacificus]QEP33751.1 rhodanese-like domain-containing protein [Malaciobacter pacificus]GGD33020.1 hypothetical protein GCM10012288_03710 [Malaciobacter pacificus]
MMKNILTGLALSSTLLLAFDIQKEGVEVSYTNSDDEQKSILVKRVKPSECLSVKFAPEVVYGGQNQAAKSVNENCKRSFVTYMGKISKMKFSEKVETVGEVEVMEFLEKASENKNMLLIDSRTEDWFYHETIPGAINVPYRYLKKSQFPEEFEESIAKLGVKVINGKYDFSEAKELLMFCNGAWCGQSPESMKYLVEIGYPEEKMKWYRGGIQAWLSLGLPVVKP